MRYVLTPCDMVLACYGMCFEDVVGMNVYQDIMRHNVRRFGIIESLIDEGSHMGKKILRILSSKTIGHIRCFNHNPSTKNLSIALKMVQKDREMVTPDVNSLRLCHMILDDPSQENINHVKKALGWSGYDVVDFFNLHSLMSMERSNCV